MSLLNEIELCYGRFIDSISLICSRLSTRKMEAPALLQAVFSSIIFCTAATRCSILRWDISTVIVNCIRLDGLIRIACN